MLGPAVLGDPCTAGFLEDQLGAAGAGRSRRTAGGATTTVTLADLGLLAADALALSRTDLERLAVEAGAALLGADPATAQADAVRLTVG